MSKISGWNFSQNITSADNCKQKNEDLDTWYVGMNDFARIAGGQNSRSPSFLICSSVKAQKNFVQKPNGRYRKHRSESAHFRKKWRKRWVSNMTRYAIRPAPVFSP